MRRFFKGLLVVTLAGIVAGGVLLIGAFSDGPKVLENYFDKVEATGNIEKMYTARGPYEVVSERHETGDAAMGPIRIWYPTDAADSTRRYPVVIMANGTRVGASRYEPIFEHLASWGFVVAGNEAGASGSGRQSEATLNLVLGQDSNPESALFNRVDKANIGAAGHSQGGTGTLRAVIDQPSGGLYKAIFTASGMRNFSLRDRGPLYDMGQIRIPYFMVAGDGFADRFLFAPLSSLEDNYAAMPEGVPAVMAVRRRSSHGAMLQNADGYMTAWFRYQLADDAVAAEAFVGPGAELLGNTPSWRNAAIKNIR
ncbi:hypothetical protein [Brevundimonas sp. FT23042]|uniref:poly(ethylene terephthalate) hydrolase family protein n=1 Tax=Brevundimonas sp. FT23042 TaxID=3393749 RepID=UPI003B58A779